MCYKLIFVNFFFKYYSIFFFEVNTFKTIINLDFKDNIYFILKIRCLKIEIKQNLLILF